MDNPTPKGRIMLAFGVFLAVVGASLFAVVAKSRWWHPRSAASSTLDSSLLAYHHLGLTPAGEQDGPRTPPASQYTIELAAFRDRRQAEAKVTELNRMGLIAYYTPLQVKGLVVYRVRLGLYETAAAAEVVRKDIAQRQGVAARGISRL